VSVQRFRHWVPGRNVPSRMFVESLKDDSEGLHVLLRGEGEGAPTLHLLFEAVVAYRSINESYRLATWRSIESQRPLTTLLIVENSRWVDWLVRESGGVLQAEQLTHFAIYSLEDCIDIVTEFEPDAFW